MEEGSAADAAVGDALKAEAARLAALYDDALRADSDARRTARATAVRADAAAADVAARRAHVEDRCRAADERLAKADAAIADAIQARDDALLKAKQAQHHAEQALATQKQCDAHELALQGKLETASHAEALARTEASSILDVARQEASTMLEEAKGRVAAAEREATAIEGEVATLRSKCAAEASTHDARVAEARKVTAALEKDAEAWAGRAKASREECERAERDLSDLRDQNAAQSTALIKATDTAQADRAFRPVWKSKFYGAFHAIDAWRCTRHTG